ncbi:MAG: flagellar basal-body rod protein FlgG [Pseudomonadota bacterium]
MKFLNSKLILSLFLILGFMPNTYAMMRALNTAATGMAAQESNVNTISNNLANVNTTAFKKGRAEFEDLLYQTIQEPGGRTSASTQHNVGVQIGSGSKLSAVRKEFTQGGPNITNNPFDIMISGDGFFGIIMPTNEMLFTRDGSFNVDAQGNVVSSKGYRLFPGVTVPPTVASVNISENGNVDAYFRNQPAPTNLGTIAVFRFTNSAGLKSEGGNLYRATASSGEALQSIAGEQNTGSVQQGSLESSNVNVMNEMTSLIKAQRAFEMNSKVMGIADQKLQTVNNIR